MYEEFSGERATLEKKFLKFLWHPRILRYISTQDTVQKDLPMWCTISTHAQADYLLEIRARLA